jgi:hypothetical protein
MDFNWKNKGIFGVLPKGVMIIVEGDQVTPVQAATGEGI